MQFRRQLSARIGNEKTSGIGRIDRRYPRQNRIRKRSEFLRIQGGRRGLKTPHFVVLRVSSDGEDSRLGITVSRRVGGAVERNHVKRRVREFFRLNRTKLQSPSDLVVIARPGAHKLSFQDVAAELAAALEFDVDAGAT